MKPKLLFVGVTLAILLVLAVPASAKGIASLIEIEVPGLENTIRVEGLDAVWDLSIGQLEDFTQPLDAPADAGVGLYLTRYLSDNERDTYPFDNVVYFASQTGGRGYVYYLGMINGRSEYDGRWFQATPEGDAAISAVLAQHGVKLDAVGLDTSAAVSLASAPINPADLGLAALTALLGLGLGWVLGKRAQAAS
jgi:hypothetical protein